MEVESHLWYQLPLYVCDLLYITKKRLYNFDPLKPHFYIVKLGFTGYTLFFLFLHTNIHGNGDNLNEISNPLSGENKKNISVCRLLKIVHRLLCANP